jgi:DNA-binding XRE family transcriptional regulator
MALMTKADNGDDIVILSREEYDTLVQQKEDFTDAAMLRAPVARREGGLEELLTGGEVNDLLAAASPLAFWRRKRGLSEAVLADTSGLSREALARIEAGESTADLDILKRLAAALRVTVDDLAA